MSLPCKCSKAVSVPVALITTLLWAGPVLAVTWIDGTVATLQALDKITARISSVEAPVGTVQSFGTLEITVNRCAFHPPEEPPENAAFISVKDIGYAGQTPRDVFSGWMFSSSPAVSALEHPVYDIIVLSCNAG